MKRFFALILFMLALTVPAVANAGNSFAVSISASELMTTTLQHVAIYQVMTVGIFHPYSAKLGAFGDIGFESSPVAGNWGGVADIGGEWTINPQISFDAMALLVNDQSSLGTAFFPGVGVGLTHYTKAGPAFKASLAYFPGTWNPSVSLGIPLP